MKDIQGDPWEGLANAIIRQAVADYRAACKKIRSGKDRKHEAERVKQECLRFFRSGWFGTLTNLDPEYLITRLDSEMTET